MLRWIYICSSCCQCHQHVTVWNVIQQYPIDKSKNADLLWCIVMLYSNCAANWGHCSIAINSILTSLFLNYLVQEKGLFFSLQVVIFFFRINLSLFSIVLPFNSCCFCPVGLSLLIQHFQQVLWMLKLLLSSVSWVGQLTLGV